jgi:ribonucleoside-diphosphate reductase alpha chain
MAAVQPFISGAISKTINMPASATVEDIEQVYVEGWKLGLKALAIYRDGSKTAQALKTDGGTKTADEAVEAAAVEPARPVRRRMPTERQSLTHKFSIGGHEGYITAGEYEDGSLGEIFLTDIGKEGSTIKGMMNAFATAISLGLQYGVPLETFVRKFAYVRFEPEGITRNPEIPFAKSMPDYIMRWLASRYGDADLHEELGRRPRRRRCGATRPARPKPRRRSRRTAATAGTATRTAARRRAREAGRRSRRPRR